jgi:hypothetical protein
MASSTGANGVYRKKSILLERGDTLELYTNFNLQN